MSTFFVDTSALAKRYVMETGSIWVRGWILPGSGNTILISRLATVELVAMLMRRHREGTLWISDVNRIRENFLAHVRKQYSVVEMETRVFSVARSLLLKHPLRSSDAIQLASALIVRNHFKVKLTFIAADHRLLSAATAEGFTIDDPNLHP